MKNKSTLCWTCSNYTDCCWHRDFTPVKNWKAEEVIIKNGNDRPINTYMIIDCPNYIQDEVRENKQKTYYDYMCKRYGVSIRTIFRWKHLGILKQKLEQRRSKLRKNT